MVVFQYHKGRGPECNSQSGLSFINPYFINRIMIKDKEYMNLEDIKKEYEKFRKKYDLPKFTKLNEYFDIEDLVGYESEFLLRKVRKIVSEKIAGYLRFFEVILNPSNAPIFFFKIIKKLDSKDKETLNIIYEEFGNLEIEIVRLDLEYDEKKEAEFIKNIFKIFSDIKADVLKIINKMLSNGNKEEAGKGSYFG